MFEEYAAIPPALKAPALAMLSDKLASQRDQLLSAYMADPAGWWTSYHFWWGMGVRNLLRQENFGEDYFGIDNLDDFYIPLVEEALKLKASE